MPERARRLYVFVVVWVCLSALLSCKAPQSRAGTSAAAHDLSFDERHGGHTLERHVGRTDAELRERLQKEPNISAASTYTDRATAERTIAAAIAQNSEKIARWAERGPRRRNLVLDYTNPTDPIGRVMFPRAMESIPCDQAIVVLRADADGYYVLTSYPECKP
ncbi:MAG: RNase A-like domain-containing protein [Terriglobales bacterium]